MELGDIASMIERFLAELPRIYEEGIRAGEVDLGWQRLDRWKRRVSQFLEENISQQEAQALRGDVDEYTDLGDEIDSCKNFLIPLLEEIRSDPDMVRNKTPVQTAPATLGREAPGPTVRRVSVRKKWDLFISYATEDSDFARPLAEALEREGLRVWYDRFVLTAGDSLLAKIDEGLARSRYGVVVLSHSFFAKAWPRKELDGLAARESEGKDKKVILPVWHGLSAADVRKYSPSLAGRIGVPTKDGVEFVVRELRRAIPIGRLKAPDTFREVTD